MVDSRALRAFTPRVGHAPEPETRQLGDEIVGIVPATGWHARYAAIGPNGRPERWSEPLGVWALVRRRDGRTVVVGLVDSGDPELAPVLLACGHNSAFEGYQADYARDDE